jgi:hypothetical protein
MSPEKICDSDQTAPAGGHFSGAGEALATVAVLFVFIWTAAGAISVVLELLKPKAR